MGNELSESPSKIDIASAFDAIKIAEKIKGKKQSKQQQEITLLMLRLVASCIRMRVTDYIDREIENMIGRKKGGRRSKRLKGIPLLIKNRLKTKPGLSPRQLWNSLNKYTSDDSFEEIKGYQFYVDNDKLLEKDETTNNERHIKFETFRRYFPAKAK